jgi:hypothetical protein
MLRSRQVVDDYQENNFEVASVFELDFQEFLK